MYFVVRMKRMAPKPIAAGTTFGRLTAAGTGPRKQNKNGSTAATVSCLCICGTSINVLRGSLVDGSTTSCGCLGQGKRTAKIIPIGSVFGRLTVVGVGQRHFGTDGSNTATTRCKCECGGSVDVRNNLLRRGSTTSCGCKLKHHPDGSTTPEYFSWRAMIRRCYKPRDKGYPRYGGRGIKVCEEWRQSYEAFLAYVGQRPSSSHTLDRFPDNNGNYEPGNVRWATKREQANNRRTNRMIEFEGELRSLTQWAFAKGLAYSTIFGRLTLSGWSVDQALSTVPDRSNKKLRNYSGHKGRA